MKRVVDGKLYDTETAELIGEDSFSNKSDFRYYDEALYKTAKGAFFLAGEGGAKTKYACPVENGATGGECLFVLSDKEALHWCEQHGVSVEVIAAHFEIEEG